MRKIHITRSPLYISVIFLSSFTSWAQIPGFGEFPINRDIGQAIPLPQPTSVHIPPPSAFSEGIRTAPFNITFNGYTPEAEAAFQFAADIWSSILISDVPIKINTYFTPLLPGLLGITLPNGRKDFSGAPVAERWYATSLANALTGTELNPGEFDMDLFLNSNVNWYFGTDGNCPISKYDFVSITLHEICHGLGFVGLANVENNIGSFGLLEATDFSPIITSFPWPDLDTIPGIYDSFLEEYTGGFLTDYPNPSAELADQFTGNQIYFYGENAMVMNGGLRPRIYAPAAFSLGSSLLHLDESSYPAGNMNELMTPFSGTSNAIHDPGPITVGILKDIGWTVNYNVGINENMNADDLIVYPNPATDYISFSVSAPHQKMNFAIFDGMGRKVKEGFYLDKVLTADLSPGYYHIFVKGKQDHTLKYGSFAILH